MNDQELEQTLAAHAWRCEQNPVREGHVAPWIVYDAVGHLMGIGDTRAEAVEDALASGGPALESMILAEN